MRIARVATDAAIGRTFDYAVPEAFAGSVRPGVLVRVEFGHRTIEGLVMSLADASSHAGALKPIQGVGQGEPLLSEPLISLVNWMSAYYLAPVELCIRTVLPPKLRDGVDDDSFRRRLVVRRAPTPPAAEPTKRQKEILDRLGDGEEAVAGFCRAWGVSPPTLRRMATDGFVVIEEKIARRDPLAGRRILPSEPLPLTAEQAAALDVIRGADRPVLLHGVTASGKTEVYLQAIADVLVAGQGAIVLVPEISLTPQTIRRFASRFGSVVAVLHSRLSPGERHDEWQRIRSGEARVAIGPRSALFAPVAKLGLIVVDEEHEPSYKQDETPRYHARDVAVMRGHFEKCRVLLGSATPSLESWNNALTGKYRLATMRHRATEMNLPHTVVVDMRGEAAKNDGKTPVFSGTLLDAIRNRLENGEQTMLFLNRRGYAPTVSCPGCGHTETCDACSVGMTYHADDGVLRCHVCGAFRPVPAVCPACGNPEYRYGGIGTQRVETIAKKLFPHARIDRMDIDVTTRKASHEEILAKFRAGKTDILIGTQMIAKGLDFPNVTLAGILNADTGLSLPDFRAGERTFQLIAQMAGRAGRGVKPGDVIVQTLLPDHPAIVRAQTEDFTGFAEDELAERRELRYPPFSHFCCVTFRGPDRAATEAYAAMFGAAIGESPDGSYILGVPGPAPIEKIKNAWRFQLTIRGEKPLVLAGRIRAAYVAYPPPDSVSVGIDVDAVGAL